MNTHPITAKPDKKQGWREVQTVPVILRIPKPLIDFFEKRAKPFDTKQDTIEGYLLAALVDGVEAILNDLPKSHRENVVRNLKLDKILQ